MSEDLFDAITSLSRDEALRITDELLQSDANPQDILDVGREAMQVIGDRFETGEYFLPELMVSGDILAGIADKVKPFLQESKKAAKIGKVVVGTVAGDIHDIAKDIVVFMLDVNGFEVIDLGVDVPAEKFVEAVQEHHAKMVGLSGPDRVAENGYLEPDIPESLLPMSGAEVILTWIPDAHVVKTLTTVSYFVIGDPSTADGPVTVPVAANDKAVRTRIIEILKEIGLDAIDVGVLRMAREIEGMTRLYMIPIQRRELDCTWEFYFRRVSGWVGTDLDDFFPKLDD